MLLQLFFFAYLLINLKYHPSFFMKTFPVLFLSLVLLSLSCHKIKHTIAYGNIPELVSEALDSMPEHTKKEMLKVIKHYSTNPEDSLKLKAAYFLIEEIPNRFYHTSVELKKFDVLFEVLKKQPDHWKKTIPWYGTQINSIIDSLEEKYGACCGELQKVYDKEKITASLIIENIDYAFLAWNKPWAKHYSFEQFCEYILPYRSMNEALEKWRPAYYQKLNVLTSNSVDSSNLLAIAKIINDTSQLYYQDGITRYPVNISPSNLMKTSFADCRSIANYKLFSMRAMGIATAIDFVPQWSNGYNGHYWNTLYNDKNKPVNFMVALNDVHAQTAYNWILPKIYRLTYSSNKKTIAMIKNTNKNCPDFFLTPNYIDVTDEYVPVSDVKLTVNNKKPSGYVFLCLFNRGFNAIDFAEKTNENTITFHKLGHNTCYFPMYYDNGIYIPAANPFILNTKGEKIDITCHPEAKGEMTLTRKCHMEIRKDNWLQSLVKAEIQVSNDKNFSNYKTIYTIKQKPSQHEEQVSIDSKGNLYRYARLVFSPEELTIKYWGDGASIAELTFLDNKKQTLEGKPFGSTGKEYNTYTSEKAFDQNPLTFYEDSRDHGFKYLGIDFQTPREICGIKYWARNDMNNIQAGNVYNLMYFNGERFVSSEIKTATDTCITFKNVPQNTVYWLKNLSGGKEERIFTYENNTQIWW